MAQHHPVMPRFSGYEAVAEALTPTSGRQTLASIESESVFAPHSVASAADKGIQLLVSGKGTSSKLTSTGTVAMTPLCGVQAWICGLSALSGFLFGYDLCVMVVALPLIQKDFELSTAYAESIVSTLMIGAVFGSLAGGVISDWTGRNPANMITAAFFLVGSLFMTFAGSLGTMLVGRFIAGLAVGSSGPCVSVYIAEIARTETRGALVTINEFMLCFGCLMSVVVSASLQDSENGWRKMLGMTLLPPIVQLVGMPFLPESPRWLLSKYRTQEASAVLKRLLYTEDASQQIIEAHLDGGTFRQSFWGTVRELVMDALTRKRVVFSMTVAFCHILTGANAMLYYSSYILAELRTDDEAVMPGLTKEILVGVAKLSGVIAAILVVDRVGRRPLLLIGSAIMLGCHFTFALCFWILQASHSDAVQTIGEWNLYVFIFAWNLSWAPLMWVVCSEMLPDDFRSVGMGFTFAIFWLGSALVNGTLLSIFEAIGAGSTFCIYTLSTSVVLGFVYFKIPETAGLSFEQITRLLSAEKQSSLSMPKACGTNHRHGHNQHIGTA